MLVFIVVCQENNIYHVIVECLKRNETKPIEMKISTNVTKIYMVNGKEGRRKKRDDLIVVARWNLSMPMQRWSL